MGGPTEDAAAVDVVDAVVLNAKIDKPAGLGVPNGAVVNAAVYLVGIHAIHVVNGQRPQIDVVHFAIILGDYVDSAPHPGVFGGIGDFEVLDLPVFLVFQQEGVFDGPGTVEDGLGVAAVLANGDGARFRSRSFGPELAGQRGARFKQDLVSRAEHGCIDSAEALPCMGSGRSLVRIVTGHRIDVVGGFGCVRIRAYGGPCTACRRKQARAQQGEGASTKLELGDQGELSVLRVTTGQPAPSPV